MIFAEPYARWLLVLHTIVAGALVAASTHLVVWMRGFARRRPSRIQAVRKFALISASLYLITLIFGNLIYPVYKVRVRIEYLEQPGAVVDEYQQRREVGERARAAHHALMDTDASSWEPATEGARRPGELPRETAKMARWFDVKEHWVALGCALAVGCALALWGWNPKRHGVAISPLLFLMALGACLTTWLGAVTGIAVSSYRAVGALGGL